MSVELQILKRKADFKRKPNFWFKKKKQFGHSERVFPLRE